MMDMATIRILHTTTADGPTNMARDEAILQTALATQQATLRFYHWSTATMSLGYFQQHVDIQQYPRLRELPYIRRHTGGAAIIHHHELTYALALPAGAPWHDGESWLCRFHHAVQRALTHWDISTVKPVICGEEKKLGPFLCFLHQTPGDLVCAGSKVVGSAQRRPHGAMVQHGSILLAQSEHTPALPGLSELTGKSINSSELASAIIDTLATENNWSFTPSEFSSTELQLADEIKQAKYANSDWNTKR